MTAGLPPCHFPWGAGKRRAPHADPRTSFGGCLEALPRGVARLIGWIASLWVVMAPVGLPAAETMALTVGPFSQLSPNGVPAGWQPMDFAQIAPTRYALVTEDGRTVVKAESSASASGLIIPVEISLTDYPELSWRWKVSNVLEKGDVRKKSGDDYAARVYVTFDKGPAARSFLERTKMAALKLLYGTTPPEAAIAYVWANRAAVGTILPNAYTDRVQMIVVESGADHLNRWRPVRRNIAEDYRRAFGSEPPRITGVAIMTDSDNTGESATAWYGDIVFHRLP